MTQYPVEYHAKHPQRFSVVQLALRLVVFIVLGALGISFGLLFFVLYLGLPAFAAIRIQSGGHQRYLSVDGPNIVGMLRWVAAVCAWTGLVVDRLPQRDPAELVTLSVKHWDGQPTPGTALARVVTGLPSALFLLIVGFVGTFVWLWAALSILFTHNVGSNAHAFLEGVQRLCLRLLVYQASLVESTPPATLQDDAPAPGFANQS